MPQEEEALVGEEKVGRWDRQVAWCSNMLQGRHMVVLQFIACRVCDGGHHVVLNACTVCLRSHKNAAAHACPWDVWTEVLLYTITALLKSTRPARDFQCSAATSKSALTQCLARLVIMCQMLLDVTSQAVNAPYGSSCNLHVHALAMVVQCCRVLFSGLRKPFPQELGMSHSLAAIDPLFMLFAMCSPAVPSEYVPIVVVEGSQFPSGLIPVVPRAPPPDGLPPSLLNGLAIGAIEGASTEAVCSLVPLVRHCGNAHVLLLHLLC